MYLREDSREMEDACEASLIDGSSSENWWSDDASLLVSNSISPSSSPILPPSSVYIWKVHTRVY